MPSPEFKPDQAGESDAYRDSQAEPAQRSELEAVLKETLQRGAGQDPQLTPQERDALLEVARRLGPSTVDRDVPATALVSAILATHLKLPGADRDQWESMCGEVASTLLDSSVSRNRIERLWMQLCEATR